MKITIACSYHQQGFHWVDKTQDSPNNIIRIVGLLKFLNLFLWMYVRECTKTSSFKFLNKLYIVALCVKKIPS